MFKNNIRFFLLSFICAVSLSIPKLSKAQTLNQTIVVSGAYATTYYFSNNEFDFNSIIYASSGLPLTYHSDNPAVATITPDNKIHPVGVGSFVLTMSQAGNATYKPAPNLVVTITFVKGYQNITFPNIPAKSVSDADFDPGANSDSNLPITYTSSNTNVATIVLNKIHIVGLGTTNITASQAGNANFNAAADIVKSLSVSPNSQTITFAPINKKFLDGNFTPAATSNSGLTISYYTSSNPAVAEVVGNTTIKINGVGTTTLTAYQLGNAVYQGTNAATTLTVSKADQSIFLTSSAIKNFDNPDFDPAGVASSSLPVSYSSSNAAVATIIGNKVHITGVGTTIITADQAGNANYNAAPAVTQTLTITKANQTITFPDMAATPLGVPDYDPGATASSGLAITYTSSNPAVADIVGNKIHVVGLGTTNITAAQAGDANNNPAVNVTKTLTVSANIQTIIFPPIPAKTIGDADFDPGAHATSNLPVTYTSDNPAVATIIANRVHITGAGTAIITANQAGNSTYSGANATATLTVGKKAQDITFNALPSKRRSDPDFQPNATASSGLSITYSSSDPSVATIIANKVHLLAAGTVTITASQAGDASYLPAADVSQTLTITKGTQIVSFPVIPPKTTADVDFDPGSTANSGLVTTYSSSNLAVATITPGNKIHIVGPGTSIITSSQAGDANYEAASASQSLTVTAVTQTINFPAIPNASPGDPDIDPGATASSGLPITYTSSNPAVATITGTNKIHIEGFGTSVITASQGGDAIYGPARDRVQVLTVTKRTQIITFPVLPVKVIGDADFPTGATINSPLTITYTSSNPAVATVVGGMIKIHASGTTTIRASQDGDATYLAAASVSRILNVTGTTVQTITFPVMADRPFGTSSFNPGAVSNSGLNVTYTSSNPAVAVIENNFVRLTGVGTTTITATQPGDVNFAAATASQPLTVIKGTAPINFPGIPNKIMSNVDFDLFATNTVGLPITYSSDNLGVATIVNGKVHLVGVGSANITAEHAGNINYDPFTISRSLTVNKGFQLLKFPAIPNAVPSTPDFDPGATVNSGLPISYTSSNPAVAIITPGNQIHIVGLGNTLITASQAGDMNYDAAVSVSQTLTVSKGNQVINFPQIPAKPLATADFDPGATVNSGLPISYTSSNPAVAIIVAGKIQVVGYGTTTITASQAGDISYNAATDVSRVLNISPNVQYITLAATTSKTFGTPDFILDATSSAGLDLTFTSSDPSIASIVEGKVRILRVGSVVITATQYGNATYSAASAITNLVITKANQTISFPILADKHMGDPDFAIGATASSGLTVFYTSSNSSVAAIIGNRIQIVGIGTAEITASQPGDANYNSALMVFRTLTVLKGEQVITFPDLAEKSLTDADFEPGATVNSGLTITYTSSNPSVATIVNGKIHIVGTGTTTITASQAGNTIFSPAINVNKVLTVRGYAQVITFNPIPDKKIDDPDFDPAATANTGLPITYSSSNTAVATIVNGKVHIVGEGTTTITASQAGDATYASASTSVTLTVEKYTQTITFPAIAEKDAGSPDFDPAATASSGLAITYSSSDPAVATIVNNKVHIIGVGSATITATQAGNATFKATTATASLVVNRANQTINFPAFSAKNYNDPDFDPAATASSGLTVSYSSSNTAVATIVDNKIHIVAAGSAVITASQSGNSNYNAATNVSQTLNVIYALPTNNFSVKATDETCKSSDNGIITVTAVQSLSYTATIVGNNKTTTHPFNTTLAVNSLPAGNYNVCITVAGQPTYKQCFDVVIKEPKDLAVYSSLKNDGNTVLLKLEGGDVYHIDVNGKVITTTEDEIAIPLIKGNNVLKISSDKTCQGVIEKTFLTSGGISLYPNPVKNILTINTGSLDNNRVRVEVNALDGRSVHSSQQTAEYGRVSIDLSKLNRGLYVLTLTIGNQKTVHKIIKD